MHTFPNNLQSARKLIKDAMVRMRAGIRTQLCGADTAKDILEVDVGVHQGNHALDIDAQGVATGQQWVQTCRGMRVTEEARFGHIWGPHERIRKPR